MRDETTIFECVLGKMGANVIMALCGVCTFIVQSFRFGTQGQVVGQYTRPATRDHHTYIETKNKSGTLEPHMNPHKNI
jgi:hypothetical protein